MPEYTPPLKDIEFVLKYLIGIDDVCQKVPDENVSVDVVDAVLDEAGKLASEVLSPLNKTGDQNPARVEDKQVIQTEGFAEAYRQFADGGWPSISCPTEYGGMGLPESVAAATGEMWASSNMAFSLCPMLTMGAIGAVKTHGNDALKQTFLPRMISGEWTGTMNLTEPQAGSDLSAVRSIAEPEGDHYRISGTKIFITWGDHQMTDNIVHLVLARLPDAPEGVKGISLFVVPKFLVNDDGSLGERNDVYPVSVEHKMGIHASPTCVMSYGDNGGAIGYLVGEENLGLKYMFVMMNMARIHVGIEGAAIAERAYQSAVAYARERVQGDSLTGKKRATIIEHPDVRRMLMQMRALTEASRAITYIVSGEFDKDHLGDKNAIARIDYLTPIAKGWATEMAQEVTSLAVQIHGGMGYIEETGVAQYQRDARIITIYEGTTGIQAMDLTGRKLIRNMGKNLSLVIGEMREDITSLTDDGDLAELKSAILEGLGLIENVARWIGKNVVSDVNVIGTAAFNFLMLNGTVLGGAYLVKSAALAAQHCTDDPTFAKTKLLTAKFYVEQILPRADAYAKAATVSLDTIMAVDPEVL